MNRFMSPALRNRQRGVTLGMLLMLGVILGLAALVGMKVFPEVSEYMTIVRDIKATAEDPAMREASIGEVRNAFAKRADVDYITSIKAADLDISKENGNLLISVAYSKKIPLFANVSLVIDFEGSSEK